MNTKAKNTVMIVFLAFLFLPFLFLKNFYPFMRFGMFADPARTSSPVYYEINIDNKTLTSREAFDVPEDIFQQWAHDHRNDSISFIQKLKTIQCVSGVIKIKMSDKNE